MDLQKKPSKKGFTLIEVLIVVGVVLVLAIAVLYNLNPQGIFKEGQDGNRVAGLNTLDKAVSLYYSDAIGNPGQFYMGSSSIAYISIPDPSATSTAGDQCQGLVGLPTAPLGYTYHCSSPANFMNADGTGWVPINFSSYSAGNPLSVLPVDPINNTSSNEYYVYVTNGTQYEILGQAASPKDVSSTADFIKGSNVALLTSFPGNSTPEDLWVVDGSNNRVMEMTSNGTYISQIGCASGPCSSGSGNGEFNNPTRLTMDNSGNIWVADTGNNRLEEFSASGTYVNQVTFSVDDGCGGTNGPISYMSGMAIESNGNILMSNACTPEGWGIDEYSSSGTYISQFGSICGPSFIAVDGSGNIWVTDRCHENAKEYSPSHALVKEFGFVNYPDGITIDGSGNVLLDDAGIQRYASNGKPLSTINLTGPVGTSPRAQSVSVDANGNMWVSADVFTGGNWVSLIQAYTSNGAFIGQMSLATSGPEALGDDGPGDIAVTPRITLGSNPIAQNIWIADTGNFNIQEYSMSGNRLLQFGGPGTGNGKFGSVGEFGSNGPADLAMDIHGNLWVTDPGNARVEEFSATGTYESQFGSAGTDPGEFESPDGIAIDPATENIWVADYGNGVVNIYSYNGTYSFQISDPYAVGVAFDSNGNAWVTDNTGKLKEFTTDGTQISEDDGHLWNGIGIAFMPDGTIWISNSYGSWFDTYSATGTYLSRFGTYWGGPVAHPTFMGTDYNGNVWVSGNGGPAPTSYGQVDELASDTTLISRFQTGIGDPSSSYPFGLIIN